MAIGPDVDSSLAILNEEEDLPKVKSKKPKNLFQGLINNAVQKGMARANSATADTTPGPMADPLRASPDEYRAAGDMGAKPQAPDVDVEGGSGEMAINEVAAAESAAEPVGKVLRQSNKAARQANKAERQQERKDTRDKREAEKFFADIDEGAPETPEVAAATAPVLETEAARQNQFAGPVESLTRRQLRGEFRRGMRDFRGAARGLTGENEAEFRQMAEDLGDIKREIRDRRGMVKKGRRVARGRGRFPAEGDPLQAEATEEATETKTEAKAADTGSVDLDTSSTRDQVASPTSRVTRTSSGEAPAPAARVSPAAASKARTEAAASKAIEQSDPQPDLTEDPAGAEEEEVEEVSETEVEEDVPQEVDEFGNPIVGESFEEEEPVELEPEPEVSPVEQNFIDTPRASLLSEEDRQVRITYSPFEDDDMTAIENNIRTLGSRRRTKDDPLGSARTPGYALSTEKRAAYAQLRPLLEAKVDSSFKSGNANNSFARQVAGSALQRLDFEAIEAGADINTEIDKALAEAQRAYPAMMERFQREFEASTRRNNGIIDPDMSPRRRADRLLAGFGAFEYGKEGFTDRRQQASAVQDLTDEERARQERTTPAGDVAE